MAKDELLVIVRMYELLKWFLNHFSKFPRSHRSLGAIAKSADKSNPQTAQISQRGVEAHGLCAARK